MRTTTALAPADADAPHISIPRTDAEHAAQVARMAAQVLAHPISVDMPKGAVDALAAIAEGQPTFDDGAAATLVHAALSVIVGAEILAGRGVL